MKDLTTLNAAINFGFKVALMLSVVKLLWGCLEDDCQLSCGTEGFRHSALEGHKLCVCPLEYGSRRFEGLLFGFVEVEFDDGFDSAAAYDAGRAESDVVESVLASHKR